MKDRYLFKAKRIDNGEWVKGSLIVLDSDSGYVFITEEYISASTLPVRNLIYNHTHLVDKETICQCTGLRDKNGNLIYEHDIAKAKYSDGFEEITEVAYSKNGYSPYLNEYECEGCCCRCEVTEIEVIGNIFDNPELLESEEN